MGSQIRKWGGSSFQIQHRYNNEVSRNSSFPFSRRELGWWDNGRGYATDNVKEPGKLFKDFDLSDKVYIVTGGARGLGLAMGEAVVEAGGIVYALDRLPEPSDDFLAAQNRIDPATTAGSLHYRRVDVSNNKDLNDVITSTADEHGKLNGAIAAAGIQQLTPAIDYTPADAARMLQVNYTGVLMTAQACARSILKHKTPDASLVLIASMSGLIANKGLLSPVYNSSKAAVIQLARNLAMEWSKPRDDDGVPGIRVNCLSPGHIVTPMVERNFEEVEGLREMWEEANMMGRLSRPQEFGGAGVFLLGRASSFMTGSNLVIDGGHTAW